VLFKIIKDIYETDELPEDYVKSLISPILKKREAKNGKNSVLRIIIDLYIEMKRKADKREE